MKVLFLYRIPITWSKTYQEINMLFLTTNIIHITVVPSPPNPTLSHLNTVYILKISFNKIHFNTIFTYSDTSANEDNSFRNHIR